MASRRPVGQKDPMLILMFACAHGDTYHKLYAGRGAPPRQPPGKKKTHSSGAGKQCPLCPALGDAP